MNGIDKCRHTSKQQSSLNMVRKQMLTDEKLQDTSELFKIMGDPSRMKIIIVLLKTELCVHDLSELTEISQSAVSHQLRILRQARLVRTRRQGKNAFYSLQDEHVENLVNIALEHVDELYATEQTI